MIRWISGVLSVLADLLTVFPNHDRVRRFIMVIGAVCLAPLTPTVAGRLLRRPIVVRPVLVIIATSGCIAMWLLWQRPPQAPLKFGPREHILPEFTLNGCTTDFQHSERHDDRTFTFGGNGPCRISFTPAGPRLAVALGVQHRLLPDLPTTDVGMDLQTTSGKTNQLRFLLKPLPDGRSYQPEAYYQTDTGRRILTSRPSGAQAGDAWRLASKPDAVRVQYQCDGVTFLVSVTFLALNNKRSKAPTDLDGRPIDMVLYSYQVPSTVIEKIEAAIGSDQAQPRFDIFVPGYWWNEPVFMSQ